jgi:hypothetical protein
LLQAQAILKTAGDGPKENTSLGELHAEGHFRRELSTLKMLLSGYLHREKSILTDRLSGDARFFLLGEGMEREVLWDFWKILPGKGTVTRGCAPVRPRPMLVKYW